MELRIVKNNEFKGIKGFYNKLIDMMQDSEYLPGWEKGVYPSDEFLYDSISNHELYGVKENGAYIGVMVINHEWNDGYNNVKWMIEAPKDKVAVIHTLGVLPTHHGQGIAQFLVKEAINLSIQNEQKVVRLDVLETNTPAQKLYTKMGFKYIDTIEMFYEDTGWVDFLLYEYVL